MKIENKEPLHIKTTDKNAFAECVLMPGDPLRAKYIAENFLEDAKLVTSVRMALGYTGYYNGKKVSVMTSGMGMPSMAIYAFELIHFYNVKKIIRIGTCGVIDEKINVPEIILADQVYTESSFAYSYDDNKRNIVYPSENLNENVLLAASELGLKLNKGCISTTDVFSPYVGMDRLLDRMPKNVHPLGEEMEGFALCYIAQKMGIDATVLVTATDSKYSKKVLTPEERQNNLNDMITLALNAITR